jgi:signal transduction histidine kinase
MGLAYAFQSNYIEAAKCYQQALKAYPQDADMTLLNSIFMDYSTALRHLKDYQTMVSVQQQWKVFLNTKAAVIPQHDKSALYANWHFKHHAARFDYYFCLENYAQAAAELDSAQHYQLLSGGSKLGNLRILGNRTKLYLAQKEYEQALAACDELVEKNKKAKEFSYELRQLDLRWEILEGLGRYEDALAVHKLYKLLSDSVNKANNAEQLNELNKRFEIDELKAEQERTTLREIIMVSSLILLGLIIIIFFRHRAAKRLEQKNQELIIANARAEESSRMKSDFIQQISHEIRTPLNILSGFTQVLTMPDMEYDEETLEDFKRQITENTDRITGLVNKMLELSEAKNNTVIECNDYVPAVQIAAEAVNSSNITNASHLTFDMLVSPEAEQKSIQTNLSAAVRALSQLLDNARKFTAPAEGHQHDTSADRQQKVVLRITVSSGRLFFSVEDTGIGVPYKEAERIFEEFVQLDEYYDGTGIGLTVARSLARRIGGNIMVDTAYIGGSRFVMTVPC